MATPSRRSIAPIRRSTLPRGQKSPKPTVDSDVKAKYTILIAI